MYFSTMNSSMLLELLCHTKTVGDNNNMLEFMVEKYINTD